ncbi:patched domain-containing protein 3-like [Littorina saxatilis]|uniref:patched domain-containing protein 3-like n=1 Tax=Littorina saxatilis TaxID=31220 RepID=UPI0038B63540
METDDVNRGQRCSMNACTELAKGFLGRIFTRYGTTVGLHPLPFIAIPLLVFGGLGAGLLALDEETDMEKVYFPINSRAARDRQFIRDTFPDLSNESYNSFSPSNTGAAVSLLFYKADKGNILARKTLSQIASVVEQVKALSADVGGQTMNFTRLCARFKSKCISRGVFILGKPVQGALEAGIVTYPYWNVSGRIENLSGFLGGAKVEKGKLVSATVLKVTFILASKAPAWQSKFKSLAANLDLDDDLQATYETPDSLGVELNKGTKGDIKFFSLTITLCCTYASVVSSGSDPVSTRAMLAFGGISAAGLGILGSLGLLSLCGVKYVNIVGVVPFLIIGIGIDDMFLLMSAWSENLPSNENEQTVDFVPTILGKTFASAAVGVTITSLTDFIAFLFGTMSVFMSVTNFSLFAGFAVIFGYICNLTFFGGCLAYHGRRVFSSRHYLTCLKTKPREELKAERSCYFALCCGGAKPKGPRDDESYCELLPRKLLPKLFQNTVVCVVIVALFVGYLALVIYGAVHLKQGLVLENLVSPSSYYYEYLTLTKEYFTGQLPINFVVKAKMDYTGEAGQQFLDLLKKARTDSAINSDFERCWLTAYRSSGYFNATSSTDFVPNLQKFLAVAPTFRSDVVLVGMDIIASGCYVLSKPSDEQYRRAELMVRMRQLADDSPLPVMAFHLAFLAYEQFIAVLPATLKMVGCAVATIIVITALFLQHVLMVFLVTLTIVMIITGIFGFMYFWDITLSSITMIHLVMSVGFSVDFSAHVCSAYLMSGCSSRQGRARDAISHAAAPIFNAGMSTLLGVVFLAASDSYVFITFFRIMVLVIVLGMLHAVLFLPAVLSLVGPTGGVGVLGGDGELQPDPQPDPLASAQDNSSPPQPLATVPETTQKTSPSPSSVSATETSPSQSSVSVPETSPSQPLASVPKTLPHTSTVV